MSIISLGGVLLHVVLNRILFRFAPTPLYLDTIATVAVTLVGGVFWGGLTGALTNLVGHSMAFWGWEGYLFALCNIVAACLSCLFVRLFPREMSLNLRKSAPAGNPRRSQKLSVIMDRTVVLILFSFTLCLAMSVLGGLITVFIQILRYGRVEAGDPNPASVTLASTLFSRFLPVLLSEILARIPINIVDRLISVFAGYGIAALLYAKLPFLRETMTAKSGRDL